MVKVGIKSTSGTISSTNSNIPAILPIFPLYIVANISADSGAHKKAKGGKIVGNMPIKSNTMPKKSLAVLFDFDACEASNGIALYIFLNFYSRLCNSDAKLKSTAKTITVGILKICKLWFIAIKKSQINLGFLHSKNSNLTTIFISLS